MNGDAFPFKFPYYAYLTRTENLKSFETLKVIDIMDPLQNETLKAGVYQIYTSLLHSALFKIEINVKLL
jgi:hypothetical protein